jgi:ankyrin repeat protein
LAVASLEGHVDVVRMLIENGANKEITCVGETPLRLAATKGQVAVVEYLLEQECDVDSVGPLGGTALHAAAFFNRPEVVQVLLRYGATIDVLDNSGLSSFVVASQEGHIAVIRILIERGANKELFCNGARPLIHAVKRGTTTPAVVEYLLEQGCDVDSVDNLGYTALHWAAFFNRLEIAQLLFRYGAKLDARNNDGETPADLATAHGHHDFATALRAEEIRRRDHGFKRDPSTIEGTEERAASKRPRAEREAEEAAAAAALDESDDDDDEEEVDEGKG